MEQETSASQSMAELLAGIGVVVTPEGRQRARAKLDAARAAADPAKRAALRARLGLAPKPA